jgi:hypothetical protein
LATIDRREASSGSEAPGVGAIGRFPACHELARARVTRLRGSCRLSLGPAVIHRVALQYAMISRVSRGVRDPVD